jgi:4-hydroxy-2-oxoheptanedioate aldolase
MPSYWSLRERIRRREELLGSFLVELPTRATVEAYALAGFDFVILDLEHSATDLSTLSTLIASCQAADIACLVRLEAGRLSPITRILDMAPGGVMIPGVRSAAEAAAAVTAARYHPFGQRGLAPIVRHELFPKGARDIEGRDRLTTVVVQLEAADALPETAAVAATPELDVVFVGPYDLSESVGHPGELDNPAVVAAGQALAEAMGPEVTLGVYLERPEQIARWRSAGASFFTLRTDGRIFLDACRNTLQRFRAG